MMIKSTVFHELRKNEIECSLQEAFNNPLMQRLNYMWIVSGQYISDEPINDAMTYVAKSFEGNNYTICTIVDGKRLHLNRSFSQRELKEFFPTLFGLTGQLISI